MILWFCENTQHAVLCSSKQNSLLKDWSLKEKKGNVAPLWYILYLPTLLRSALLRTWVNWYFFHKEQPSSLKSGTESLCRWLLCRITSCSWAWVLYSCLAGLRRSAHAEFITLQLLRSTEAQDGRGQFTTRWIYSLSQVNEHTRPSNKITFMEVSNSDLNKPREKTVYPLLYNVLLKASSASLWRGLLLFTSLNFSFYIWNNENLQLIFFTV